MRIGDLGEGVRLGVVAVGQRGRVPAKLLEQGNDLGRLAVGQQGDLQCEPLALFVESVSSRGSLSAAARRFGLTRREVDVLRLLVASQSSAEIAHQLCIARSTVADHVQSLFRKTKCTKRTELLNTFFQT